MVSPLSAGGARSFAPIVNPWGRMASCTHYDRDGASLTWKVHFDYQNTIGRVSCRATSPSFAEKSRYGYGMTASA